MLLAIDVGNTQTVFGVYDGEELVCHLRLSTDRNRTTDEYAVQVRSLLAERDLSFAKMRAAVLASVVPPLTRSFVRLCETRLGAPPLVVGPGIKTGMPVLYENPREVGADRIVNAVAGYELYRTAPGGPLGVIVVDFGTATTFDVISPRGEYLGGAISPGVGIATEALFQRASKLPRIELGIPPSAVGKNTVTSMQAGILFGYAGLVDGMVARMMGELDFTPRVIATGGLARLIAAHTRAVERCEDHLTLFGLRLLWARNQKEGAV